MKSKLMKSKLKFKRLGLLGLGLMATAGAATAIASCAAPASAEGVSASEAVASGTNQRQMSDAQVKSQSDRFTAAQEYWNEIKDSAVPSPTQQGGKTVYVANDFNELTEIGQKLVHVYDSDQLTSGAFVSPTADDLKDVSAAARDAYIGYYQAEIAYVFVGRNQYSSEYADSFTAMVKASEDASSGITADAGYLTFLDHLLVVLPHLGLLVNTDAWLTKYGATIDAGGLILAAQLTKASLQRIYAIYQPTVNWLFEEQRNGKLTGNIANEVSKYADMYASVGSI